MDSTTPPRVKSRLKQSMPAGVNCSREWLLGRLARVCPRGARVRHLRNQLGVPVAGKLAALNAQASKVDGALVMEKVTPYKDASSYNNFYEFGTDKSDPAANAGTLKTTPWTVEVEGLVEKPGKFSLEDLLKLKSDGGAYLPPALRRRVVYGHSMGGLFVVRTGPQGGAFGQCQICGVRQPWQTPKPCHMSGRGYWTGPMSRACAWMRPCIP